MNTCNNNPNTSYTTAKALHKPSGYMSYMWERILSDNNKEMRKVRDHCHYTEKYRGAAHSKRNLNYKIVRYLYCFIMDLYMTIIS